MNLHKLATGALISLSLASVGTVVAAGEARAQSPDCDGSTRPIMYCMRDALRQDPIEIAVFGTPDPVRPPASTDNTPVGVPRPSAPSVVADASQQKVADPRSGLLTGGVADCTAFAISPTKLLTAAHCVYDSSTRTTTPPQNLGYYPSNGPYGTSVIDVKVSPQWIEDPGLIVGQFGLFNSGADWAVLTLSSPVANFYTIQLSQPAYGSMVTAVGAVDARGTGQVVQTAPGAYGWDPVEGLLGMTASAVQSRTNVSPGFSGGPLLDPEGRVIAVNSNRSAVISNHARITCEIARFAIGYDC